MVEFLKKKKAPDYKSEYKSIVSELLSMQLTPGYSSAHDAFGSLMTNKLAAGYVHGFHYHLLNHSPQGAILKCTREEAYGMVEDSYKNIFGPQAGHALLSKSVKLADDNDAEYRNGVMVGIDDADELLTNTTPPLGLDRILTSNIDPLSSIDPLFNPHDDNPVASFQKAISNWPKDQEYAALMVLKCIVDGGDEEDLDKYMGELTVIQSNTVAALLDKIVDED